MIFRIFIWLPCLLGTLCLSPAVAEDWPQWRYDSSRSAASPAELPSELTLKWVRKYAPRTPTWDDPLNNDLMQFDRVFEPIVLGDRLVMGFNDSDKVVCFGTKDGEELWRYYTDGPVRLPPVGWQDKIFVASDDGYLHCLDAESGKQIWRFRGGPSSRKVLGNRRVISMWPARGGPVVRDGQVYFAASIWPMMGTFIYALDAESGQVTWVNDGTSASFIKQPHSAPSFAGVAPQGAIAATEQHLVIPGGRSVPAVFDRDTGQLVHFHLNAGGKGTGGSLVIANETDFYVHTRLRGVRKFDLVSGKKTAVMLNEPVLATDRLYTSTADGVQAVTMTNQPIWHVPVDGGGDLIRAGDRLYAAGERSITAISLHADGTPPTDWREISIDGHVRRLLAADGMLFAVTEEGGVHAFGAPSSSPQPPRTWNYEPTPAASSPAAEIREFLQAHHADAGYGIVFGVDDEELLDQLIAQSELHLVVVESDESLVRRLRRKYDREGIYGRRVVVHRGTADDFSLPPYIANLVVVGTPPQATSPHEQDVLKAVFQSVRPYGGVLWFALPERAEALDRFVREANLSQAEVSRDGPAATVIARRVGPLPGAAPWTHLYGNVANTVKSDDRRVKSPLGILWFGGNTHMDVLPRHSHSPSEQVIGGRLFVEGVNSLSARDVYTGRLLWRREFEDLGIAGIYFDETYKNTPLDSSYNQVHIPGANVRGTNYVVTDDELYLVIGDACHVLDTQTGATTRTIRLPAATEDQGTRKWTYIGVYENVLLAGVDYADYSQHDGFSYIPLPKKSRAWSPEWFGSQRLVAFDRHSGETLWSMPARYSFLHNGIVAGNETVFLLDKLPLAVESYMARRGRPRPDDYRILALNVATGEPRWERNTAVFGTWLSYSTPHDILVHAGAAAPDRSPSEIGEGLITFQGSDGSLLWHKPEVKYAGPFIIHNDWLIANSRSYLQTTGVFQLSDGRPVLVENPLTGIKEPWQYKRAYGCNTAVASEYLLTFRSGAAGYYDLEAKSGVGNLGGFRSGCSSNLIVADGVLNAPDFTRTCSCGYQNQTSLALIHMPEVETWGVLRGGRDVVFQDRLQRVGLNLGAPGARRSPDGVMWLPVPSEAQEMLPVEVEFNGEQVEIVRRHASIAKGELPWVTASGVRGAKSVVLTLAAPDILSTQSPRYALSLHFTKPADMSPGEHFVDILVNGQVAMQHVDLAAAAEDWQRFQHSLPAVQPIHGRIILAFKPSTPGQLPFLSGIELVAEE